MVHFKIQKDQISPPLVQLSDKSGPCHHMIFTCQVTLNINSSVYHHQTKAFGAVAILLGLLSIFLKIILIKIDVFQRSTSWCTARGPQDFRCGPQVNSANIKLKIFSLNNIPKIYVSNKTRRSN